MKSMGVSRFKAQCIAVLKRAQRTHTALIITHRGKPLARVEPLSGQSAKRVLGDLKGRGHIRGDIVHFDFSKEWELRRG